MCASRDCVKFSTPCMCVCERLEGQQSKRLRHVAADETHHHRHHSRYEDDDEDDAVAKAARFLKGI